MRTIILNSTNLVAGSNNTELIYQFPAGSVEFHNDEVAINSIALYYSWFNVSTQYNNTTYSYIWLGTTYPVVMPNGNFNVTELNSYLQDTMINNGHYLVNSAGDNVYYLEWILNPTRYAVQFNAYPIPTALPVGWTNPAGVVFPAVAETPQVVVPNTGFATLIGFNAGTYPSPVQSTQYSKLSDTAPQLSPVSSLVVECNLINNPLSTPSKLLYAFTPVGTVFGEVISIQPPEFTFNDIASGFYNQISVKFKDQNLRDLIINDPQMVILLVIRKKWEMTDKLAQSYPSAGFPTSGHRRAI